MPTKLHSTVNLPKLYITQQGNMLTVDELEQSLWLVIPTAGRRRYLESIFENSLIPRSQIVLVHTLDSAHVEQVHNINYQGEFNIHSWWNLGISYAETRGAKYIAVLNDDAQISKGCLRRMLNQMISEGTTLARPAGTWGHCWILRLDRGIRPDEIFRWYMGDHDLERRAKRNGGVTVCLENTLNLEMGKEEYSKADIAEFIKMDYRNFFKRYKLDYVKHIMRKLKRLIP